MNYVSNRMMAGLAIVALLTLSPEFAVAQDEKIGSQFLPADAMAVAVLSPAKVLASETMKMYPTEIADAWCLENVGVPLKKVESVRVVVATPGPNDAMFGALFRFTENVDLKTLNQDFVGAPVEIDDRECFELNGPLGVVVHQLTPDSILVASSNYLDTLIRAREGKSNGALARYADAMKRDGHLTVVLAVEPVRPLITGLLQTVIDQIPPPFIEFTEIPELLDAVALKVNVDDVESGLQLALLGRDSDSSEQLLQIIENGLAIGRDMAMMQIMQGIEGEGAVPEAMRRYTQRMADKVVDSLTPKRSGKVLSLRTSLTYGTYTQMMMLGVTMPALQQVRFAAPGARADNNLKMIGLAMHNHHSAYRALPDSAIRDDEGEPLLSWRVKILPFIEQQALYEQFHLDEPWDSDHNIKLLKQIPDVYRHPKVDNDGGKTHYLAPISDANCIFNKDGEVRFRDVLDGLSNTVMVVEVDEDSAVEWTKPADWEADLDNPFKGLMMLDDADSFRVLMCDGAVARFTTDMGKDMMKSLLTIAGGETIGF